MVVPLLSSVLLVVPPLALPLPVSLFLLFILSSFVSAPSVPVVPVLPVPVPAVPFPVVPLPVVPFPVPALLPVPLLSPSRSSIASPVSSIMSSALFSSYLLLFCYFENFICTISMAQGENIIPVFITSTINAWLNFKKFNQLPS